MKELEDEYAKQAWQADKVELKMQEMLAESSSAAAETVSRIAKSQEKEAKAATKAEQLEGLLRDLHATLALSQDESLERSKQIESLQATNSDLEQELAERQSLTDGLEAKICDLEVQLNLSRTAQQSHEMQEKNLASAEQEVLVALQQQRKMGQMQMTEANDALQDKQREIDHLEKMQEEERRQHSSLAFLRDQLDLNCRELKDQIQQLDAANKEKQVKETAMQLRLERVEAEAEHASGEARAASRQQEFAFETLMARCKASETSVQQLEEARKQLRSQLALQESKTAESAPHSALMSVDVPPAHRSRALEAQGLQLAELEFTLREVEVNSDRLKQSLEQSQANLEMQTEEKLARQQSI